MSNVSSMPPRQTTQKLQVFEDENPTWTTTNELVNAEGSQAVLSGHGGPSNGKGPLNYVENELAEAKAQRGDKPFDATELYCDPETVNRLSEQHFPQFHLPRLARCGNGMFGLTYRFTVVKGQFSLHHAWRWETKKIFSLKFDKRDLELVRKDQGVRSKLADIDTPRIIHAERQDVYCLTIMEPMAVTVKYYMRYLMNKTKNAELYYGMLLRTGRQCVRYLQRLHQNGFLHGNINPQTFVFPYKHNGKEGVPDFERGPLIIDYAYATNWKEDPIYKEENPEKLRNNAIHAQDGGMYTRRDDMENLGYLLVFLAKGFLRWEPRRQREFVMSGKKCISDLNKYVKGIPLRIKDYLTYIRILKWNEEPDYDLLDDILSDKKVDIRKEIKIRRERRAAEKRQKRRRRSVPHIEGKTDANVTARARPDDEETILENTQRSPTASAVPEENSQSNRVDTRGDTNQHTPICESPDIQHHLHLPPEMRPDAVMEIEEAVEAKEEQPNCAYCSSDEEHNPTLEQCLNLNTYRDEEYQEMLTYGRPDPFPAENFEEPDSETPAEVPLQDDLEELLRFEEADETEMDDRWISEIIHHQNSLPARRLEIPRAPVEMISSAGVSLSPYNISGRRILGSFQFVPWESDDDQNHPWERHINNNVGLHEEPCSEANAVDVPSDTQPDIPGDPPENMEIERE